MEARLLSELLVPLNENFDAGEITDLLRDFQTLAKCAEPQELQHLIRACVRRIEWKTDGNIKMQLYKVGKGYGTKTNSLPAQRAGREWLYTDVCNDTSKRRGMKPLYWSWTLLPEAGLNLKQLAFIQLLHCGLPSPQLSPPSQTRPPRKSRRAHDAASTHPHSVSVRSGCSLRCRLKCSRRV